MMMMHFMTQSQREAEETFVPNTFIGGIAKLGGTGVNAPILTAAELAIKLGIDESAIEDFRVDGSDVECHISDDIDIPLNCFINNVNITSFKSSKVTSCGSQTFKNCSNLSSVVIPLSTSIGNQAFMSCSNLSYVDFPLITSIDSFTFFDCSSLISVDFPFVTFVGSQAFIRCSSLISADIPLIVDIKSNAFNGCSSLTSVDFPFVANIEAGAFADCSSLISVDFPLATFAQFRAFYKCSSLLSAELPLVSSIGTEVFMNCSNLSNINIPLAKSLGTSTIDNGVFNGIQLGAVINSNIFLKTAYNGGIEGDLGYAVNSRQAQVMFYDDDGNFVDAYPPISNNLYTQNDAASIDNEAASIGEEWYCRGDDAIIEVDESTISNHSLKFSMNRIGWTPILQMYDLIPGDTYKITLSSKSSNPDGTSHSGGFIRFFGEQSGWDRNEWIDMQTTDWKEESVTMTAIYSSARLEVYPSWDGDNVVLGSSAWIDNFSIENLSKPEGVLPNNVPAFPSAVGGGKYITGGRGGRVIKVTNLNDSGPGSLREALLSTGPRIVVFDVSGVIHLETPIDMIRRHSDVTVAGQTAPHGGITISNRSIHIGEQAGSQHTCNNVIFRYIRFRNASGPGAPENTDQNAFVTAGNYGTIVDHCSIAMCNNKGITMRSTYGRSSNISITNNLFSQNGTQLLLGHNDRFFFGDVTLKNNLYIQFSHRTPNMGGSGRYDIINNAMIAYGNRLSNINVFDSKVNNIGNYYQPGQNSANRANVIQVDGLFDPNPTIYSAYNYHPTLRPTPIKNDDHSVWTDFTNVGQPTDSKFFTTEQFPLLNMDQSSVLPVNEVVDYLLDNAGAHKTLNEDGSINIFRDSFDEEKITKVINSDFTGTAYDYAAWYVPVIPQNTRPANYDLNNDGIPRAWKVSRGFSEMFDLSSYVWESGYIGIEEYLNEVDN